MAQQRQARPGRAADAHHGTATALRAALLLALLTCASAANCAPGRSNSVDGSAVATDSYNANNVVIAGCNNTVQRANTADAVTITGSDDVVSANVGATQTTVTGSFDAVVGNDVSQSGGAHTITVSDADHNVLESNTATQIELKHAKQNIIGGNTVTAGGMTIRGGVKNNVIQDNTMGTNFEFDYDNVIVNNTAASFRAQKVFNNNTYRDNIVSGSIVSQYLTASSIYIANTAAKLWTKYGSVGNTVIGNIVAAKISLCNGAFFNTALRNVVDGVYGLWFYQGSMHNTVVDSYAGGDLLTDYGSIGNTVDNVTVDAGQNGYIFNYYGASNIKTKDVVALSVAYSDASFNDPGAYSDATSQLSVNHVYFNMPPLPPMPPPTPPPPDVAALQATIATLQAAATTAAAAISTLQTAATADASTITTLQTTATTLQTAVTTLQTAATADTATITLLQAAVATCQTAATADAVTIATLQAAVSTLQATVTALQAAALSGGGGGSGSSGSALSPFSGVQCASAACGSAQAAVNAFIGNSNVPISQAAAQNVTDALSIIVSDVAPTPAQLTGVVSALDTLAVAMLNNITAVGTASVTSPLLNMTVGLISPDTATSAALAGITGATFDPLPAGTFAGVVAPGELVRLQYTSLGFDPYGGVTNGSGVVSLSFTREDGTPLSVANLSEPITFAMPAPAASADSVVACRWWDARQDSYSSVGTFALPSPRPAGHAFSWAPGASVENGDYLAESWRIDGPLTSGCTEMVLDCRSGLNDYESIALDPFDVAGTPIIVCGAVRQRLRVFYGADCALWQQDNAYSCHWDAPTQSFIGAGCVAAATTQCATLHLTSFVSTAVPRIAVASASDLTDIDPADLVSKLRMLFGVVIGLFGLMHVGALLGRVQDGAEQSAALARLRSRSLGFAAQKGGAWTWRCTQDAVSANHRGVRGSLVELARQIGMPYIRLRAAIPEALLPGSVAAASGCVAGLSASAVSSGELSKAALTNSCEADVEKSPAGYDDVSNDGIALTSTALAYALMSMRCMVAEVELERQLQLSASHFASLGADDAAGTRLRQLKAYFAAMLAGDNLRKHKDWLNRARLWRLVLLSSDSGSYDPAASGLAFALQAVSQRPVPVGGIGSAASRLWACLGTAIALEQGLADDARPYCAGDGGTYRAPEGGHATDAAFVDDCPLSFSSDAILGCMPPMLFAPEQLAADAVDAGRLWTTALCCALMETLEVSWALNQPAYPGQGAIGDGVSCETLLDRSSAFLATQFTSQQACGAVMAAARAQTAEWAAMQQQRVGVLRAAQLSTRQHAKLLGMRLMGDMAKAGAVGHSTLGIFLAPLSDGIRRWQAFVVVVSTLVALLTVNIWLTYSKALLCCQDYRALLSCSADFTQPCRGSAADCVDLPSVFAGILDVGAPADWTCTAFPDTSSSRDSFLMGLISFACSLPVTLLIANTFACANAADYTPAWLRWSARRTLALGRHNWRYSRAGGESYLRVGFASAWGVNWYYNALQAVVIKPQAWLAAADQRRRERRGEARLEGAAAAARSKELQYAFFVGLGVAATYICWTIFAWLIFAYGALMYKLLGAAAQASFTKTWAIGVGISQAAQFRDMILTAAQGLAVITVLDGLWLVGNGAWLEAHADLVCVDAALRDGEEERGGTGGWWPARLRGYVQFFSGVTA